MKKISKDELKLKVLSFANSIKRIPEILNYTDYNKIFCLQLENYCKIGNVLICFSSSVQSKNIIQETSFAKKKGVKKILFQDFGKLNKRIKSDYYINLNCKNHSEDIFQLLYTTCLKI